jgi:cysteine desulfurase
VVSAIEHPSLLDAARLLGELGATVSLVAPDAEGVVAASAIVAALQPRTRLVALMAANNETGVLQPVAELAPIVRARGIAFHVDAVAAIGRTPFDVAALPATTVALTAHKLGGPPGSGALFVRRGHRLAPFVRGGRQERGLRGGTQNLLGILGFGAAAEAALARQSGPDGGSAATRRLAEVRDEFERQLAQRRPDRRVVGGGAPRLANTSSITLPASTRDASSRS